MAAVSTVRHVRPHVTDSDVIRDVPSASGNGQVGAGPEAGDGHDVRARWAQSAAQAASQAYAAAYGREIADDSTRIRWRLEPRIAVTAALVVVLLGVGAWWSSSSPPALPAHVTTSPVTGDQRSEVAPSHDRGATPDAHVAPQAGLEPLIIHVSGAVARPGLVSVGDGARVADAVDQAGGITLGADISAVNLARLARDGEHIHIPVEGEVPVAGAVSGPVSLSNSDAAALETLPGIGPVLAQRIIADREANGPYESLQDLVRVSGVGEALVAGLQDIAEP